MAGRNRSPRPDPGVIRKSPSAAPDTTAPTLPAGRRLLDASHVRAVTAALVLLGEEADAALIADSVRNCARLDITAADVELIREALRARAQIAPGPDQPPPENARRSQTGTVA